MEITLKRTMIAALAAGILVSPVSAHADPDDPIPAIPPAPGEGINIPGMVYGAGTGQVCAPTDKFGRTVDGLTMVCVAEDSEDDPATPPRMVWTRSAPLAGVRISGSSCSHESTYVAMSPNSELMMCLFDRIVTEKRPKNRPNLVWTVVDQY